MRVGYTTRRWVPRTGMAGIDCRRWWWWWWMHWRGWRRGHRRISHRQWHWWWLRQRELILRCKRMYVQVLFECRLLTEGEVAPFAPVRFDSCQETERFGILVIRSSKENRLILCIPVWVLSCSIWNRRRMKVLSQYVHLYGFMPKKI